MVGFNPCTLNTEKQLNTPSFGSGDSVAFDTGASTGLVLEGGTGIGLGPVVVEGVEGVEGVVEGEIEDSEETAGGFAVVVGFVAEPPVLELQTFCPSPPEALFSEG